ncbi:MAG: phage terminase large subunit family protein [Defluviitaleaceae bacterium]|nr:phage terminase large subunit family protein [Defluviitaleaceae bacterium]
MKAMKAATHDLFRRIFAIIKPPPNMTLSEWADKFRYLSKKTSAEPGKWKTSKAPYQREIMDAISDINTQKVIVMSAAQIGKTDGFILNTCGYYMDYDPCPIMILQPNAQPMAESFSKDRLTPMLRDTPRLRGKVNSKTRNSGNTILHKEFPGGYIVIVGANSPAGLSSRPIRLLLADEVDRYPPTAGKEGDPLLLASKRLTTFWNKREVYISTPTIKGASRIEVEYENSTQEVWHVPCPACGIYQPLVWAQVEFDRENISERMEVFYKCEKCEVARTETEWKELFTEGKFVATYPKKPVRGFHLNALASLFVEWRDIVIKFIEANEEKKKGNIEPLKVWTNTEMGQTWEEPGSDLDWEVFYNRREKYNCEIPGDVMILTAGIDTQDDRFEVEVVGWGAEKESWGIQYAVIRGDLKQAQVWKDLDAFLSQTFTREDGAKMHIARACIDAQGHFFNEVCAYCKTRVARGIYPIRGVGGFDKPYIPRPSTNNRVKVPLFNLGVDTGKALLYQSLGVEEEGANYCHFPKERDRGYGKDYFRGLTAERMVLTYKRGKSFYIWKLKEGQRRNEPLDTRNYAQAALEISTVALKKSDDSDAPAPQTGRKRGIRVLSNGV